MAKFSPSERRTLVVLELLGPRIPADIAEATGTHPRTITRTLRGRDDPPRAGLVERGLVVEVGRSTYCTTVDGSAVARWLIKNWKMFEE